MRRPTRSEVAAAVLLIVGLSQMAGDLLGLPVLKGLGAATAAAPAPKVFTAVRGYEAFSTRFALEYVDAEGRAHVLPVTPERYAQVRGPYNRRNVYGAALSFAPVLSEALREPVTRFALCDDAPLLRELGVTEAVRALHVRLEPRPGTPPGLPLSFEVRCP
jgi:hypothetical protein